ncbi:hypothetical protein HYR69_04420, partial [Candidatus Sumerlaeota bacterium]|nr:hypothetical protein [Candidatus Sumerlaeota bacterium]
MRVRRWTLLILLVSGLLFGRTLPCAGQEPSAGDEPAAAKAENPAPKAPEEKKSAAETGEKSLEEYLMLLRKLSSEGNFEKVLSLCDEAQKKFPDEETLNYFRTRAQRSIEERQAKGTRKFHSLRDMPTKAPPAETPSESASPAGQPAEPPPSEAENAAPEKTPAATPRAAAKTPAPAEPSVISSPTRAKSGNKWFPLIVGFALASGIVVVVAGILMIRRDKPRTAASMPSEESMMDYSAPPSEPPQSAPLFQPPPDQPWNTDPLGSFAKSTQASEDDLFSQEQSAAGSVAAPVRTSDMEEDSSFQSAELFSADEPA